MSATKVLSKRSPPPSSKRVRTRSFNPVPNLPTPDDPRSIVSSVAPSRSRSVEAEIQLTGPANPGVVRRRNLGVLARLPHDSDVLEEFGRLKKDGDLSDEEAFLKFISTYDVSLSMLNQISSKPLLPIKTYSCSFISFLR